MLIYNLFSILIQLIIFLYHYYIYSLLFDEISEESYHSIINELLILISSFIISLNA